MKHKLSDYNGKIVLLNFWASWCKECLVEMPSLNRFYERFKTKEVEVFGISIDREKETVVKLLKRIAVTYRILLDTKGDVFVNKYTVIGLPTTVIIDQNGFIQEKIIGSHNFESEAFIKKIERLVEREN